MSECKDVGEPLAQVMVRFLNRGNRTRDSVYLDTNAWSCLAKGTKSIEPLRVWLERHPHCYVLLSRFQIGELAKDSRLAERVADVARQMRVLFVDRGNNELKGDRWHEVDYEKILPIQGVCDDWLSALLRHDEIRNTMRQRIEYDKAAWQQMLSETLAGVPAERQRSWREFPAFVESWIRNRCSANGIEPQPEWLQDAERYIGLRLSAGVIFLRYYIQRQHFGDSDYLDFLHSFDMPYARIVVTERNLRHCIDQTRKYLPRNGPDRVFSLDWLDGPSSD